MPNEIYSFRNWLETLSIQPEVHIMVNCVKELELQLRSGACVPPRATGSLTSSIFPDTCLGKGLPWWTKLLSHPRSYLIHRSYSLHARSQPLGENNEMLLKLKKSEIYLCRWNLFTILKLFFKMKNNIIWFFLIHLIMWKVSSCWCRYKTSKHIQQGLNLKFLNVWLSDYLVVCRWIL